MDDEQTAPSADAGVLSLDTAVERLNKEPEPKERPEGAQQEPAESAKAETVEKPVAEEASEEPSELQYLHGNARTRLRDGTEVTVAELKKRYGETQDFQRQRTDFEQRQSQFTAREAQIAQQEQFFQQQAQFASAVLQSRMPAMPDPSLRETDPIAYYNLKDEHERAVMELSRLSQAQEAQNAYAQQQHAARFADWQRQEFDYLTEKVPEMKSDEGKAALKADIGKYGMDHYGFTREQLNGIQDHRMIVVLKDAIAYRKLQDAKPKVIEKAKDAPPVVQPGARPSQEQRSAAGVEEARAKLRKSGSMDDALALLNLSG